MLIENQTKKTIKVIRLTALHLQRVKIKSQKLIQSAIF